jgi:hypothetical protein
MTRFTDLLTIIGILGYAAYAVPDLLLWIGGA